MPCFTAQIVDNQIRFNCSAHKPGEQNDTAHTFMALLDTGAQASGISQTVVDKVGLTPISWGNVVGVSGVVETPIFLLDIGITIAEQTQHPDGSTIESVFGKAFEMRQVSLLDFGSQSQFDILLGMDVIMACNLSIHSGHAYTLCI